MNKVMALAIMECQNKNTQMIKHFLQTFNKCLQDYTGIGYYKFDPYGIMCDEGGTNMNAIEEVFGKEFMAHKRVVTCQWHFKSCARRQLPGIDKDEQKSFEGFIAKLCECYTKGEYDHISSALKDICDRNDILHWWEWWEALKYHIIPAFRGFKILGLNLAETGHSMIKTKNKIWLSMATYCDVCFFIIQDQEHIGYQQNTVKSTGKRPNLLAQKLQMNKAEKNYIKQCVRSLEEGNITDNEDDRENGEYFVPNKKAKHKVPKHYNQNNPTQKKKQINSQKKVERKTILERKCKHQPSTSSEDEDTETKQSNSVLPQKEKKKLQSNPLLITFINDQIKKCSGCETYFEPGDRRLPKDLVFKICIHRPRPFPDGTWRKNRRKTPAYFHVTDMACVHKIKELKARKIGKGDIYMENKVYFELTTKHIKYLQQIQHWNFIKNARSNTKQ